MKALYSVISKEAYCLLVVEFEGHSRRITPAEVDMPKEANCHYLCTVPDAVPCGILGKWTTAEYNFPWEWFDPIFKFAARDKDGQWYIYSELPSREGSSCAWSALHHSSCRSVCLTDFSHPLDKFIPWEGSLICRESSK